MESLNYGIVSYALMEGQRVTNLIPPYNCEGFIEPFKMSFHGGCSEVVIPDIPGGYIVSCGCGAGKTTNIEQLITERYHEGVLYCVDTKNELDKMRSRLIIRGIPEDMILMIHGDVEKDVLKKYHEYPDEITKKPILLITHCRLFTDMINLFLIFNPKNPINDFDGDMENLMHRDDLRHWILIDETPLLFKPFVKIRRSLLGYFDTRSQKQMMSNYKEYIMGTDDDLFKTKNKLTEQKLNLVFNLVPHYLDGWKKMDDKKKDLEMHFYTSDLIQPKMTSNVIVFEGAGDILFRTTRLFKLIDIEQKYNTEVLFEKFDFDLQRRTASPDISQTVKKLVNMLQSTSNKTLVVLWKNIGKRVDDEASGHSEFCCQIEKNLLENGCDPHTFSVTYYGASNTKSTNEFRDYQNIILCGNWDIGNDKVKQIQQSYMSSTSPSDLKLWYFIQLICRIAIRNHQGGRIKVWYSSDFKDRFINKLSFYLNKNQLIDTESLKGAWFDKMSELKIRVQIRNQIVKLNELDSQIGDSILCGKSYRIKISLKKLLELFPKKKKTKREFRALKDNLNKLRITLEIS